MPRSIAVIQFLHELIHRGPADTQLDSRRRNLSAMPEHLVDPWNALRKLRAYLKPGGIVLAGSPNVCHYSVLLTLLCGRWRYEVKGIFDATHLRWFSPSTYATLFEECGFRVESVGPADLLGRKGALGNLLTLGMVPYLFHEQIYLRARC
jgi:hypothetical protein